MNVSINVPDDVIHQMQARWEDLSRSTLEALAIQAYKAGIITEAEVQRMLEIPSRWEVDAFLKVAQGYLDYNEQDLQQDIEAIRRLQLQ